jgi:amino acid transporter
MVLGFFERYKFIIPAFLLFAFFLLAGYLFMLPRGVLSPDILSLMFALILVVLFVAITGASTVGNKKSKDDLIVWSSKGLDLNKLVNILEKYPEIGELAVNEKNEGMLTALYYPQNDGRSKVEMTAEKTPIGTDFKFTYSAGIYRNGMEFLIIFFLLCTGLLGIIISLPFFDKRNKENKNLQNSIYHLINYIEQQKK